MSHTKVCKTATATEETPKETATDEIKMVEPPMTVYTLTLVPLTFGEEFICTNNKTDEKTRYVFKDAGDRVKRQQTYTRTERAKDILVFIVASVGFPLAFGIAFGIGHGISSGWF